jgi:hypothetical protein
MKDMTFSQRRFSWIQGTSPWNKSSPSSGLQKKKTNQETRVKHLASRALLSNFLLGLFFNPEDGGDMFHRKVG